YTRNHGGVKHPLADQTLDMVWLKVPNLEAYNRVAQQIESSVLFSNPAVRCETLSSGVVSALEGFRDLIWALRWLLTPAILATMTVIIANAISISVRERRSEIAVLKVLGFRPTQVLSMVLGEAMLIGSAGGLLSASITYGVVNKLLGSPEAFALYIPDQALWGGLAIGGLTALAGSLLPAWSACRVNVAEVFARV